MGSIGKTKVLNNVFDRLRTSVEVVSSIPGLNFAISEEYGAVTSCPTNLGSAMRASVHYPIPNLTAEGTDTKAKAISKPYGLQVRGTGGEHTPIGAEAQWIFRQWHASASQKRKSSQLCTRALHSCRKRRTRRL